MGTQLDHLYNSAAGSSGDLTALQNQVNSLSQIAAKTNLDNRFTTNQTVPSITITGAVDTATKAATKGYVDGKLELRPLQTWSGNMQTTNLEWTKTSEFSQSGIYAIQVKITANNKSNYFNEIIKIDDLAGTWISPIHLIDYGQDNSAAVQTMSTKGIAFVYQNKKVKLVKYGTGHPTTASITILYNKVW